MHYPLATAHPAPPFDGWIETTHDALLVLQASRIGVIPRVPRRFSDEERRTKIASGRIFVFDEGESAIQRWTDSRFWSPSRGLDHFLMYREVSPRGPSGRSTRRSSCGPYVPSSKVSIKQDDPCFDATWSAMSFERNVVASLSPNCKFKPYGLVKKTISVTVDKVKYHIISYYDPIDVREGRLSTPTNHHLFAHIQLGTDLLRDVRFHNTDTSHAHTRSLSPSSTSSSPLPSPPPTSGGLSSQDSSPSHSPSSIPLGPLQWLPSYTGDDDADTDYLTTPLRSIRRMRYDLLAESRSPVSPPGSAHGEGPERIYPGVTGSNCFRRLEPLAPTTWPPRENMVYYQPAPLRSIGARFAFSPDDAAPQPHNAPFQDAYPAASYRLDNYEQQFASGQPGCLSPLVIPDSNFTYMLSDEWSSSSSPDGIFAYPDADYATAYDPSALHLIHHAVIDSEQLSSARPLAASNAYYLY